MSALGHKQTFAAQKVMSALHPKADMHSIRLPCVYYFFLAVVVIGYETTATACWTLLFIVRAFFDDTITVAVWTGFHVRLMGMLSQPRDYICWCFADPARPHDVRFPPESGHSEARSKCLLSVPTADMR